MLKIKITVIIQKEGNLMYNFDLDICYQGHDPEFSL